MIRSSTNKLFTPFKDPEREFRSLRRHFKTLSLNELRSPDFDLFFDQEYSEEEVAETMAETMEKYMSKTRADYASGVVRPKIEDKDNFELKGQFLKELRINTFSGLDHEDVNEHIKKSFKIVDLFHIPNITIDQVMLRAFPMSLTGSTSRASISVTPLSTYLNLRLDELAHTKLTVELADMTVKYPKGMVKNVLVTIGKFVFPIDFIILDMPEDIKVPLILRRPFLSTAHAKIDVYKREITLRVGEERIIFISVKPASSLIKRVYMLSLRERMELDLKVRLIGKTLVLNRSLDPFFEDYIELNYLNEPFKLKRNQGDDLMPTIKEGEVIKDFRIKDDKFDNKIDDYPSDYDYDKKIHIDCAHNLKFSCMIGFEFTYANFFSLLYVNVMSKKFHNFVMKVKMEYKGNNVFKTLMNIPIFVGTFSILTNFAILEDMDAYRDEGMGDVIFGEPFLREVGIKTRHFEGMVTIYNGKDEVTYQMVRSHPRFKHHTNEQCNKIPPLLKVSEEDMMNGISHTYQKLKGFYKGVLNLGPDYIRDAKNGSHASTLPCMRWNDEEKLKISDSVTKKVETSIKKFQELNHINFFNVEHPEIPNDDERVDPSLNSAWWKNIADFPYDNPGNDAQSSDDIFAAQDEQAEAFSTTCFTQNRSLVHTRYNKTPYELIKGRKPNVQYFHVFGSLCYPTKNHDDLGKIKPKVDIDSSEDSNEIPLKKDLDNLFGALYEECYEVRPPKVSNNSAANTFNDEDTPSSSLIIVKERKAPQLVSSSEEPITSEPTTLVLNNNADESIQEYDPSNMHEFYQQYFSTDRWAKNHPIEQVLGNPSKHAMTRSRLHTYVKMCMYALTTVRQVPNANETIRFMVDNEEITYTVNMFCSTLKLPVETPKQPFIPLANFECIQPFLRILGYQGILDKVRVFFTKNLAQPRQTMFKVFKRCLTSRLTGHDQRKINVLHIFHVVINKVHVDYSSLIWWDLLHYISHKKNVIQYPHFTKLIIANIMEKFESIPKILEEDYHTVKDDTQLVNVYTTREVTVRRMVDSCRCTIKNKP
nr:hypothetical protein [Tanacetum cinerariifolium]